MSTAGSQPRVAVVGATGLVGSQLLELLGERGFPYRELKLFASAESISEKTEIGGRSYPVTELGEPAELKDFDIAFLAVPQSCADEIVRARPGPVLIDLSAAGRAPGKAPMIAPGLTSRERIAQLKDCKAFETPHPAAHAIAGILKAAEIESGFVAATVILSASSGGRNRIRDLVQQSADLLNARLSLEEDEGQAAFNMRPAGREPEIIAALSAQVRELLGQAPDLQLRVVDGSLLHGNAIALYAPSPAEAQSLHEKLRAAPGILLVEEHQDAGVVEAVGQEALLLNLRSEQTGFAIWCTFDNARRAALAALWIAEGLIAAIGQKFN